MLTFTLSKFSERAIKTSKLAGAIGKRVNKKKNSLHGHAGNLRNQSLYQTCFQEQLLRKF